MLCRLSTLRPRACTLPGSGRLPQPASVEVMDVPAPGALLHGTRRGVRLAGGTKSLRWIGSRIEDFAAVIDLPSPAQTFRFELKPGHSLTLEAGFAWGSSFSAAIAIPPGACGQRHPAHAGQSPAAARQGLPGRSVRRARGRHAGDPGSAVHPPRRHAAHSAAPVGHCRKLRLPNPTDPECFGSGDGPSASLQRVPLSSVWSTLR